MAAHFDARSLDESFACLDDVPEALVGPVVTLPVGTLSERAAGLRTWRDALLDGRLPPDGWPPAEIAAPARKSLVELGLVRFCRAQVELVDTLLANVFGAFTRAAAAVADDVSTKLRELEALERRRLDDEESARALREKREPQAGAIDEEVLAKLRDAALRDAKGIDRGADAGLMDAWGEHARAWSEIADVFGDLGEIMGRGWDLSLGVLRHTGWRDLLRLRELLARLPQLREIVRTLGRLHDSTDGESVAEKVLVPIRRVEDERREVRTPLAPTETRGVERSGEIARMLPAEAAMLGHPKLRLLWHARRAERTLTTYRVEGVVVERIEVEREGHEEIEGKRPRPERGPILVIVDTSGSMHGAPEQVAKALVLETLRTAHAEHRRCFVYAYSGPGQVLEHELDLSQDGIGRLLEFLGFTFGGGNDETGVMQRALTRLKEKHWSRADVLFVSDGEWPVPARLMEAVNAAREKDTRFHGVQIGNVGQTGLHRICDPVHVFRDWATLGGWR